MKYMQASYTVEATAIIGMTMLILMTMILLGFDTYHDTVAEVSEYEESTENPTDVFRFTSAIKSIKEE